MNIETLTDFFMWCSIINIGLFTFWALWMILTPDLVYKLQTKFFPLEREAYDKIIYAFMGAYKLFILVFNLIPFIVLRYLVG